MKVFVTGSSGFVGSHLCERLQTDGHEVYALYRSESKRKSMSEAGVGIRGGLSTDESVQNEWVDELPEDLDAVVHVAGATMTFRTADFFEVNHNATRRLLLDLRQRVTSPLRFTLVSSLAAAGPSCEPQDESRNPAPVSNYGKSKRLAEESLGELAPDHWHTAVIRPPIVIGPRDSAMLDLFKMVRGRLAFLPGVNGRRKLFSFVGVHDLCDAIVKTLALAPNTPGEGNGLPPNGPRCYFASHPATVTMVDIMQSIGRAMNRSKTRTIPAPMPLLWGASRLGRLLWRLGMPLIPLTPDKVREARQAGWVCSGKRAEQELGVRYNDDLDSIIRQTYEDYLDRGWLPR